MTINYEPKLDYSDVLIVPQISDVKSRNDVSLDVATNFKCGRYWKGTPVMAASSGVVEFAGLKGGYGNAIDIRHCNGRVTRYGHLLDGGILVQRGQKVSQGGLIGRMGSTGLSTGSHLHFEVRINGQAYNPKNFVKF
jgi:murein DD-endopeptidase MepM/ murein hydrolase activator NlpD